MTTSAERLADYVMVFDGAIDRDVCAGMVQSFEGVSHLHVVNGKGNRNSTLDESGWVELDITPLSDEAFKGYLMTVMEKYQTRYNEAVGLTIPVPYARRFSELIVKRYRPGGQERFQPHFDSLNDVSNRYLVFLWYLNDLAEGGETEFLDLGISVAPKAGRLVVFPPYWMFQHRAHPPRSGPKYILSTYALFDMQRGGNAR